MSIAMFIYAFVLFYVLTPGILLSLPPKGGKMVVAAVHALVFAIIWSFTSKYVWMTTSNLFSAATMKPALSTTKPAIVKVSM